jgi:hypothetical protein
VSVPAPVRFAAEAVFLVAVGLALAAADLDLVPFALVMSVTWLVVASGERLLSRTVVAVPSAPRREAAETVPPVENTPEERPELRRQERETTSAETPVSEPEPEREPEPVARPQAQPEPERESQPEEEPEEEPEEQVVALPQTASRRPDGWNLWDLERRARQRSGRDRLRDEEWNALFVSLRDFASPDGTLPAEFDELVEESFGELISRRA